MRTIFITIYDGDTEKNLLQSSVLSLLERAGMRIILLIKGNRISYFKKYANKNIIVEPTPEAFCLSEKVYFWLGWNLLPTYSIYMRRYESYLKHRNWLRYKIEQTIGLLGRFKIFRNFFRWIYFSIPDNYGGELFNKYKPDILFAPNMFSYEDGRLLRAAKKRGIKTITTSKSMDALMNKAFTRVRADKILVQNEPVKKFAISIGDYREEQVVVVGFVQFDLFTDPRILTTKEEFFKKIGADPKRKLILYSTSGDWKNPYDDEVVLGLHKAIEEGDINQPAQILARFHPKYPSKIEKLNLKYLIKDRAGKSKNSEKNQDGVTAEVYAFSFDRDDLIHLANTLYHSDVTINTMSTITLDAIVFDKPVILIEHDGFDRKLDYWHSIRRAYDEEHYKIIMHLNATRSAKTMNETIHLTNDYLKNSTLDKEKRDILKKDILYKLDGKAGERIASEILKLP